MAQETGELSPPLQQSFVVGVGHMEAGRWAEAASVFHGILAQRPDAPGAHYNLGVALTKLKKLEAATIEFQRTVQLKPDFTDAWNNLGTMMREGGQPAYAIDAFRRAVALQPNFAYAWNNLAGCFKDVGQLDESLACFDRSLILQPDSAEMHGGRVGMLYFHPRFDQEAIYREARRWNDQFARPLAGDIPAHDNDPSMERRLRVGYVSPYLRRHCLSLFASSLLAHHDHNRFEIFCYSCSSADKVTSRLRRHADTWCDVATLDDEALAQQVREDKIDILVDLTLHMVGCRLLAFARKPAPVQVTWLGYPGTTGVDAIDYRLTDPRLDPVDSGEIRSPKSEARTIDQNPNVPISKDAQDSHGPLSHCDIGSLGVDSDFGFRTSDFSTQEPYYSERSVRLPHTFWCYEPRGMEETETGQMPEPSPLPALTSGHMTFGCLNNFCKVTDQTLVLWARVMASAPTSQLILLAPAGPPRALLTRKLGVDPQRVKFVPFQDRRLYLETFHQIDLCLDTLPYNGHTTSLDSFWMGVPVVTRVGNSAVGRAGWSQLHNLGLLEFVAWSDDDFVKMAVQWSRDLGRLSILRAGLRQRMERSPLMDGARFARNIESAYQMMWQAWCRAHG